MPRLFHFRFRSGSLIPLFLILFVLGVWFTPKTQSAGSPTSFSAQRQQDLQQRFRRFEIAELEPETAARQVRESGTLWISTPSRSFELELEQNDLRASNYRAEEVTEGGFVRQIPRTPVRTYKGRVRGMPQTEARLTIDDFTLEGMIITPDEWYFVEEARKYSSSAKPTDYLVYKASDVIQDSSVTCGVTLKERIDLKTEWLSATITPEVFSPFRVVELATEADFEYVTAAGGSTAANNEILSVINQVQGIYETQIGLTLSIVLQHTWATSADPYSVTGDSVGALNEFTNYWNANFASTNRDVAHLWTGRSLNSAGIAWVGVVCRAPAFSYGLSIREIVAPFRVGLPAHEMGHNFSASHSDGTAGCNNTIMQSIATPSTMLSFCQFSIDEITNYVNSNSSCLSTITAGSQVQFSTTSYNASEGGGSTTITVTRTGSTVAPATIDFATADGTAQQRSDYTIGAGTLGFAAGESSKSITLLITDDLYTEGPETISITLSNPTGVTIGTPGTATLTIADNDVSQPSNNPLDDAQFFVRQQYYDFLSREPDPGGFAFWTSQITECGTNIVCVNARRIRVSNAFFYEQEFQETGAYVYRVYKAAFGTMPGAPNRANLTYAQFMPDRARVIGGSQLDQSKADFANAFVQRSAFIARYPNTMTPALYVDVLNTNTGNSLTQPQRDALVTGMMNGTETPGSVLRAVADNQAFIDGEYSASFVLTEYFGYLRRDPDQGGYDFWLGQVNRFPLRDVGIQNAMVCSFLTSIEYQQRFSTVVTHTNQECSP